MKALPTFLKLLALLCVSVVFIFVALSQAPAQVDSASGPQCQVCDGKPKPKTLTMACKDVDKYLDKHPTAYAGACTGVSNEKPPKP